MGPRCASRCLERRLGEGLPDVATRRLLLDLHRISLDDLGGFLDIDTATLSAWEDGEPDPDDERVGRYRSALGLVGGTRSAPSSRSGRPLPGPCRCCATWGSTRRAARLAAPWRRSGTSVKWENDGQDYFDGEVEPCINGKAVALGAYFGENVDGIVERLLGEQLEDGGWNCEAERGSTRSSFHTTISVLDGFLEYERANGAPPAVTAARHRGEEYLLERRLFRRLSTGEVIDPAWTQFSFPTGWRYDVLRGLDYLQSAGGEPDERCEEAIDLVESKRDADGRWPLENTHPGRLHFEMDEGDGKPSRWNTLRAMRVLAWYGRIT